MTHDAHSSSGFAQRRANCGNGGKAMSRRSALLSQCYRKPSANGGALPMKPYLLMLLIGAIVMFSDLLGNVGRAQRKPAPARLVLDIARNIGSRIAQRKSL